MREVGEGGRERERERERDRSSKFSLTRDTVVLWVGCLSPGGLAVCGLCQLVDSNVCIVEAYQGSVTVGNYCWPAAD
jgi:hypothetical protein